jgi:hypothetical protein
MVYKDTHSLLSVALIKKKRVAEYTFNPIPSSAERGQVQGIKKSFLCSSRELQLILESHLVGRYGVPCCLQNSYSFGSAYNNGGVEPQPLPETSL